MAKFVISHGGSVIREIELGERTLIGRSREADVQLAGSAVSRRHAVVLRKGDEYILEDLGSENGTFVDGEQVERIKLTKGMKVQIADYILEFDTAPLTPRETVSEPSTIWGADDSTAPLDIVASVSADRVPIEEDIKRLARPEQAELLRKRLEVIYRVSRASGSMLDVDELLDEILSSLAEVLPQAERGFIALREPTGEFKIARMISPRPAGDSEPAYGGLSDTIAHHVTEKREAVLCKDARTDFSTATSVQAMNIGSLMCVPLAVPNRVLGIMQWDARGRKGCFSLEDLNLVTGVASIVSVAIEKARLYSELKQSHERLQAENVQLRRGMGEWVSFASIIGKSQALKRAISLAKRVAGADSTVLITGESGTGKELLARAIHSASKRCRGPFVAMNCAALPETLLESELFGIEKGVATGVAARAGKIEQAAGGTLFLDEVGDMTLQTQAKMLRILEKSQYQRVGGRKWLTLDARIIAATNKDLRREMEQGNFREDLFYRLNVVEIHLPPLRERKEDIPLLAEHFLRFFANEQKKQVRGISPEAMQMLIDHPFPGNVRELRNAIERGVVLVSPDGVIEPDLLPPEITGMGGATAKTTVSRLEQATAKIEKEMIQRALEQAGGNRTKAAKILGISREGLRLKMKRYGIE